MSKLEEFIEEKMISSAEHKKWVIPADDLRELGKTHVLVPREPTEEMIASGIEAAGYNQIATCGGLAEYEKKETTLDIFAAMIQAESE